MKKFSKLREWRLKRNLSQEALASKLRTDQSLVSKWESGRVRPFPNTLTRIAEALNVRESDLR